MSPALEERAILVGLLMFAGRGEPAADGDSLSSRLAVRRRGRSPRTRNTSDAGSAYREAISAAGSSTLAPPNCRFAHAKYAALNLERAGIFEHDIDVIGLAVFGTINPSCPLVCAFRPEPDKDLQTDNRPIALARIDIADVGLGLAGLRIIWLFDRGDGGAELPAAARHSHRGILLGTPSARRIGGEARNCGYAQYGNRK